MRALDAQEKNEHRANHQLRPRNTSVIVMSAVVWIDLTRGFDFFEFKPNAASKSTPEQGSGLFTLGQATLTSA